MFCDLHTHSYFSDGTLSPSEIVALAKEKDLAVALTDHNTVKGLKEFTEAAEKLGVTAVAGVELATDYNGKEIHLLGLFIDEKYYSEVEALTEEYLARKKLSNTALVENLKNDGYNIDYASIEKQTADGNVNRVHVARELVEKGYLSSVKEAFDGLLREGAGYYTATKKINLFDAIGFLTEIKALPVIAHPLKELSETELCQILPTAIERGLCGIETMHSDFDGGMTAAAKKLAKQFSLLESGGSDFHGANKPHISLGIGKGNLNIPFEFYRKLNGKRDRTERK